MSEERAAYLQPHSDQRIKTIAAILANDLIESMVIDDNHKPDGTVEIQLIIRIEATKKYPAPDEEIIAALGLTLPEPESIFTAHAALDSSYDCHLDGFGPYREVAHRSMALSSIPALPKVLLNEKTIKERFVKTIPGMHPRA